VVAGWCGRPGTSRRSGCRSSGPGPYRKNDQAWVEQKNGSLVRRLGYRRLEGLAAVGVLARLYDTAKLFANFFQSSFKLASKTRVGAHVTKRCHLPATPSARLLASDGVPDATKEKLRFVAASLDPLRLLEEIRTMQTHLAELAASTVPTLVAGRDPELDGFLKSLRTAWLRTFRVSTAAFFASTTGDLATFAADSGGHGVPAGPRLTSRPQSAAASCPCVKCGRVDIGA
jgi:hypothetical protein